MSAMRVCKSCSGPVPGASKRCPWCHSEDGTLAHRPEHMFATFEGQAIFGPVLPPPDARWTDK